MSVIQAIEWAKTWRGYTGTVGFLAEGILALKTENQRLRDALEQIANGDVAQSSFKGYLDEAYQQIAKGALKNE